MASRSVAGGHTLPPDPIYLDFERSDGDPTQQPTNTKEVVDKDGQVNYMKPVGPDDSWDINWRSQIARKIAERLGKPPGKKYVLRSWPDGYRLYCHHKGKQSAPRQDLYLMGSIYAKRFRSVPEFVPHAIWLMTDPTLDRQNCECKYCAKVPQRVISENLGYKARSTTLHPTPTPSPGVRMHRIGRDRERQSPRPGPNGYATVRRTPKPKPEKGPTQVMLQERYADLQAMYVDTNTELRRWFRIGELVWCALDPPIHSAEGSITFWPGLVDECTFKAETVPRPKSPSIYSADGEFDVDMEDGTSSVQVVTQQLGDRRSVIKGGVPYPITPHPGSSKSVTTESPLPWIVHQKTVYKVKLLGVNHDYVAIETQVLPYQGYAPSRELLEALENVPIERITSKPEEIATFNPCPAEAETDVVVNGERFAEATAPYTLAIEIASGIATCWTPTDEWEFKMMAVTQSQTRYQGLWLGSERIWTDDLVRLKAARGQIAPQGSAQILAPSGPSKSTIAELGFDEQTDPEVLKSHGARDRGVFMHLEALFVVSDVPDPDGSGVHAECRASGMLYELADEDWDEPQSSSHAAAAAAAAEPLNAQDAWAAAGLSTPTRRRNPDEYPELHVGQPFMSAPSPLKQPPVTSTTLRQVTTPVRDRNRQKARKTTTTKRNDDGPNIQLSHPKMNGVPLPPAPRGFRFRPILPEGFEVVVSLALVSGRYYPRLLAHPLLRPIVRDMQGNANEAATRLDGHHLFALEGILPGFFNASEATRWKPGRSAMVRDAAAERSAAVARSWEVRRQQAREGNAYAAAAAAAVAAVEPIRTDLDPSQGQDVVDVDVDVGMHSMLEEPSEPRIGSIGIDVQPGPPVQDVTVTVFT
ncbi:hypothetical protein B0F90DRAFT_1814714 [Multifurca ochricompacta]|uniref:Cryptic loci regulator 2 N-terminal domain-containing protein n=1 Tax=Multifurca ochricompacta TaxID=376703 RepID=A0AAD4QR85_9AGAM|nr:hypothetical protein B0F90DRAFT_1814714 [Multifurca ochricompacta]